MNNYWHRTFERKVPLFAGAATIAILIGGIVEIVPMYSVAVDPADAAKVDVYTPLEQAGRDIYVREGCYNCHSQMIRPMYAETLRYGEWSRSAEYNWDRPFQLGSRRIGPDLAREGGLRSDAWHYDHFRDPRAVSPGSIMPAYGWLYTNTYDVADVRASIGALHTLGAPYTEDDLNNTEQVVRAQADQIVATIQATGAEGVSWDQEVIALIAYLQRLGTSIDALTGAEGAPTASATP
jgi:cytochrome c oxidase cbb3-type subunit I/II